jgi:predicted type IV restriction endonuclease
MKMNIVKELRKFLPLLLKAREENLNEADTAQRVIKVFENVLGYNAMTEITCEMEVRSKYADLAIKIESVVRLFVEIKSASTVLRDRHVDQSEMYAAKGNVKWVLLTNGVDWNLYHLTFDEGLEYERVFAVSLSNETLAKDAEFIGLLHRASVKAGEHEDYWKHCSALSADSIGRVIFTEHIMLLIRREIRRKEGILIAVDDIATAIHSLFTQEAKERIGPPKIKIKKPTKSANPKQDASVAPPATQIDSPNSTA